MILLLPGATSLCFTCFTWRRPSVEILTTPDTHSDRCQVRPLPTWCYLVLVHKSQQHRSPQFTTAPLDATAWNSQCCLMSLCCLMTETFDIFDFQKCRLKWCRYRAIANPQCFGEVVARCTVLYANPTACSQTIESRPEEQLKTGRIHPLVRVVLHPLAILNRISTASKPVKSWKHHFEGHARHATWLMASYLYYMYIYVILYIIYCILYIIYYTIYVYHNLTIYI
jgi:hypothetical protein